jgi:hypothetical protein
MRRTRLLLTFAARAASAGVLALCLVALVAGAAVWATSYWVSLWVEHDSVTSSANEGFRRHWFADATGGSGEVFLRISRDRRGDGPSPDVSRTRWSLGNRLPRRNGNGALGFDAYYWGNMTAAGGIRELRLQFPLWFVLFVAGVVPMLVIPRIWRESRRRRREMSVCCIRCGYDLRASPKRCPECGSQVAAAAGRGASATATDATAS